MPVRLVFQCAFTGQIRERLTAVSHPASFSNDLCRIASHREDDSHSVSVTTEIVVNKLFVSKAEQDQVPPAMEHIENAMRLAVIFK